MSLVERFGSHLAALKLAPGRALVAVSGGLDSVALLDLLVQTRESHGLELVVAHLDHGISAETAGVADRVAEQARSLGLPFVTGRLELGSAASETAAREARYEWLRSARVNEQAGWILTAHHADDQAETVLLRVLGGSGPAGLAGMRAREGVLVRPLLPFHRAELEVWAHARDLWWWDDPANRNPRHLRSWLRSVLLPSVRERIPDVDQRLLDVGVQASVDRGAWDSVLTALPGLDLRPEVFGGSIRASAIVALEPNLAASVIMAFVRRAGGVLGLSHAHRAAQFASQGRSGSRLELPGGWVLERAFDRLLICRPRELATPTIEFPAGLEGSLDWGDWRLVWRSEPAPALQSRDALTAWFIPEKLSVRSWRAGDRVVPIGGRGHRLAVRCFQDRKVPRLSRAGWPVFDHGGTVLWIPGVCRSAEQVPAPGVPAVRVDAAPR